MNTVRVFILLVSAGGAIGVYYTQGPNQNKPFTEYDVDIGSCSSLRFKVRSCGRVSVFFATTTSKAKDYFVFTLSPNDATTICKLTFYPCNCNPVTTTFQGLTCAAAVEFWASWSSGFMKIGLGSQINTQTISELRSKTVNSIVFGGMSNVELVDMDIVDDPCMFPPTQPPIPSTEVSSAAVYTAAVLTTKATEDPGTQGSQALNLSSPVTLLPGNKNASDIPMSLNKDLFSGASKQSMTPVSIILLAIFLVFARAL